MATERDPEAYREYQREYKRKVRREAQLSALAPGKKGKETTAKATTKAIAAEVALSEKFTSECLGDLTKITQSRFMSACANLSAEMIDIGAKTLRGQFDRGEIDKPADAMRLIKLGVAMMAQVVHTVAPEPEEETRDAVINAHRAVLATPEGKAATQTLMILRANELRRKREEEGK